MSLPTKTRPDTTVGWALAETPVGKPKAHFSRRRGTCAGVSPAAAAGWNRVFAALPPHAFQPLDAAGSVIGGFAVQRFDIVAAEPAAALPIGRPDMNSARIFFCVSLRPWLCVCIDPVASAA